jgi:iron complex outermembrane recepter protein
MKIPLLQILLISLGIFSGRGVLAQQFGQMKGYISTVDGKPAGYVTVGLQEVPVATLANEDGHYRLNRIKPGTYTLKVSAVGLESQEKPLVVAVGQMVTVDFILNETSARLQEVVVQGTRNRYKTDKPSASLRLDAPLLEIPQNIQVITSTLGWQRPGGIARIFQAGRRGILGEK